MTIPTTTEATGRMRVGSPRWLSLHSEEVEVLMGGLQKSW